MASKKSCERVRKALTLELKKEIIEEHNKGARVVDIADKFNLNKSTVGTILAKKELGRGGLILWGPGVS